MPIRSLPVFIEMSATEPTKWSIGIEYEARLSNSDAGNQQSQFFFQDKQVYFPRSVLELFGQLAVCKGKDFAREKVRHRMQVFLFRQYQKENSEGVLCIST